MTPPPVFSPEAVWIGPPHPFDLHEAYLCFRSPAGWQLNAQPRQAALLITADSRYKLWVNGRFVARGPARCYPHAQAVDTLDLSPFLRRGSNTLAVQVYQPGYSHFAYVYRAAAGLLAQLTVNGHTELVTGPHWTARRDPSYHSLVPRVSIYGSGVEVRRLHLADGWILPDYDAAHWEKARVVAPVGGYPWTGLRPRGLPLLEERSRPITLLQTRLGRLPPPPHHDAHLLLRAAWNTAAPHPLPPGNGGWFNVSLDQGQTAFWLFDMGRDFTCQGWAEIEGAGGQEQLLVSYVETVQNGQPVLSDPQTYCRVRLTDRFYLRPGSQTAAGFSLRGGRYLLFCLTGPAGPAFRFRPQARVSEYPLKITRLPGMSDPQLDGVISICRNTFQACLQDGFVDSTWRESSQWLGDALPQSLIMSALTTDTRPLRQVIEMAAQGAYPDGVLPGVIPAEAHAYTVVDYNFMWVELLNLHHRLTGNADFTAAMWPVLVKLLDRFHQDLNPDGLLISQPGRRLFLDWAPLSRREPNAVYNLHYLLALQTAVALARNRAAAEAGIWQARAGALQTAIRAAFWRNRRWYDDRERTTFSQLAASLAVLTRTARPAEAPALLEAIAARSLDTADEPAPDKMVLASPFMHHYVFEALHRGGQTEQVIEIIRRRWGRWVKAGSPTTWENWAVDFPDGSRCHAFSAHPLYHLARIARSRDGV